MKIIADLHVHNGEVCGHANTDIPGLLKSAKDKGHCYIAITDHAPRCDNTPPEYYINNLSREGNYDGVYLLAGIEADILDIDAHFDLPQKDMLRLNWVISSMHPFAYERTNSDDHTKAYINALNNPAVDCLGHIGRDWYPADYERIVKAVKETGKTLEINNHSFDFTGENKNCKEVAKLCKKYNVAVVITSDAHENSAHGEFPHVMKMLKEIDFPEELVINADKERLESYLRRRKEEKLKALERID